MSSSRTTQVSRPGVGCGGGGGKGGDIEKVKMLKEIGTCLVFFQDYTGYMFYCIDHMNHVMRRPAFYAPNFEKVDGAYCFWSVGACVGAWVTLFVPTVTFKPLKLES